MRPHDLRNPAVFAFVVSTVVERLSTVPSAIQVLLHRLLVEWKAPEDRKAIASCMAAIHRQCADESIKKTLKASLLHHDGALLGAYSGAQGPFEGTHHSTLVRLTVADTRWTALLQLSPSCCRKS